MLHYKAARPGRAFIQIPRDFPSSRRCAGCGPHDGPKPLRVRRWTCPNCDTAQDRDWNAARNVRQEGRRTAALTSPIKQHPPTDCRPSPGNRER
ncbi:zinc ribbon domain-containing protein [Kitasatospora sp. NPDC001683]